MTSLKTIYALFLLFVSNLSFASLITYGSYTLDTETNIVTDTSSGLEWLQWDVTVGMSIVEAISEYEENGWVLANNIQMASLFNDFSFNSVIDEFTQQAQTAAPYDNTDGDNTSYDIFISLFGTTSYKDGSDNPNYGFDDNALIASAAKYGESITRAEHFNNAVVRSDFFYYGIGGTYTAVLTDASDTSDEAKNTYSGVALVRVYDVNSPATVGLTMLVVLGLGIRRRFVQ